MSTFPLRIAIGSDHAGFPLKKLIAEKFSPAVVEMIDCGTHNEESCDFPKYAAAIAREVVEGRADRGIAVCGSGIGVCMAANKVAGIRASVCHDTYSAHQGVEHDGMNVICLGARIIGQNLAFELVEAFLGAQLIEQEKFQRRIGMIDQLEKGGLDALL